MRSTKNTVEAEHHMQYLPRKGALEQRRDLSTQQLSNNMHNWDDPGIQVTTNCSLTQHLSDPVILSHDNVIQRVERIDTEIHDSGWMIQ